MKLRLLLITSLLFFSIKGLSQAEAYPVNDLVQCGDSGTDLTVNTPLALGSQDPNMYSVTYFETEFDAQANANPILNASQYFTTQLFSTTIYIRVSNNTNDDFDITSFAIISFVTADYFEDVFVCGDVYIVPADLGNVYTGPTGTGTLVAPGTVISTSTTLYIYNQLGPCTQEASIEIMILDAVTAIQPTPIYVCDENNDGHFHVVLSTKNDEILNGDPNLEVSYYTSYNSAIAGSPQINQQTFGITGTMPFTVYVRVENVTTGCYDIVEMEIIDAECTGNLAAGTVTYDMDNNGCTDNDVLASGIEIILSATNYTATTFTTENGDYYFYGFPDGPATIAVASGNGYSATPVSTDIIFPGEGTGTDFCIVSTTQVNDIAVTVVPVAVAQSGFPTQYILVMENNGTQPASGTVTFQFDDTKLIYNNSSPLMTLAGNTLSFAYTNLLPFQSSNIYLNFTVMVPQIVPAGELLVFTATIDPVTGDANPVNNTHVLEQFVVNAMDPNDITVHEGETITPEETDEYLHYTIRFQNEGSANAVNIRVEAETDEKLDWTTFEPIASSHDYSTVLRDGEVEFLFNNINLTWADNDEPASHGYITYRVKPQTTVGLGDTMQGSAGIFFDFNDPVMTNTATTTVQNALGRNDISAKAFTLYPNPASETVTVQLNHNTGEAGITVTDVLGKTVQQYSAASADNVLQLNVSALNSGIYYITVTSGTASSTQKLIIK